MVIRRSIFDVRNRILPTCTERLKAYRLCIAHQCRKRRSPKRTLSHPIFVDRVGTRGLFQNILARNAELMISVMAIKQCRGWGAIISFGTICSEIALAAAHLRSVWGQLLYITVLSEVLETVHIMKVVEGQLNLEREASVVKYLTMGSDSVSGASEPTDFLIGMGVQRKFSGDFHSAN